MYTVVWKETAQRWAQIDVVHSLNCTHVFHCATKTKVRAKPFLPEMRPPREPKHILPKEIILPVFATLLFPLLPYYACRLLSELCNVTQRPHKLLPKEEA